MRAPMDDIDGMTSHWNGGSEPRRIIKATPYKFVDPRKIPPRQFLHGRHMIRQFISVTVSAGGTGKTSEIIVEALELVTGFALVTSHRAKPVRVWIWNGEDPKEELQRRIQAACIHYKIKESDIGGRLFVDSGRDMPIIVAEDGRNGLQIATPVIDGVKATISENRIDALYVDPFVRCHRVPENDNGKINAVAEAWAEIADRQNCGIDLVHHIRKTIGEVTTDDARGAVALIDAGRASRALNRMTKG
jgi:RecA-family ATPase